jgi:hypothetical protein
VIVCFVDIGEIVDHHYLEVIVRFVDIGRIVDHLWNHFNTQIQACINEDIAVMLLDGTS